MISKQSEVTTLNQLTLFAPESHARTFQWLENALDWQGNEQVYSTSLNELFLSFNRNGLSLKIKETDLAAKVVEWLSSQHPELGSLSGS